MGAFASLPTNWTLTQGPAGSDPYGQFSGDLYRSLGYTGPANWAQGWGPDGQPQFAPGNQAEQGGASSFDPGVAPWAQQQGLRVIYNNDPANNMIQLVDANGKVLAQNGMPNDSGFFNAGVAGLLGAGLAAASGVGAAGGAGAGTSAGATDLSSAIAAAGDSGIAGGVYAPATNAALVESAAGTAGYGASSAGAGGGAGITAAQAAQAGLTPVAGGFLDSAGRFLTSTQGIQLLSGLGGAYLQTQANNNATDAYTNAANNALAFNNKVFDATRADTAPWRQAGEQALNKLTSLLNDGSLTSKFAGMNPQEEAGYRFAANEGQRNIDARAAARGGFGGALLKDSTRFAEDNANKFYNDAFQRFQQERANSQNPLFQLAGLGTSGNQLASQSGTAAAQNSSNVYGGLGSGLAGAAYNQGNIYGNVLSQFGAGLDRYLNPPKP